MGTTKLEDWHCLLIRKYKVMISITISSYIVISAKEFLLNIIAIKNCSFIN